MDEQYTKKKIVIIYKLMQTCITAGGTWNNSINGPVQVA